MHVRVEKREELVEEQTLLEKIEQYVCKTCWKLPFELTVWGMV